MSNITGQISRRSALRYAAVLGAGIAAGGALRGNIRVSQLASAASPSAGDATATREAELAELHALQTQVANPPVCTPGPTETPAATATEVPVSQTGVPLPYGDIWTITVLGIAPTPGSGDVQPAGKFMQVNLTVAHSSRQSETLLFTDFVLMDDNGRFSKIGIGTNQDLLGLTWGLGLQPGVTETRSMIFDVAVDAGNSFILESNADPTFRVALSVEERG